MTDRQSRRSVLASSGAIATAAIVGTTATASADGTTLEVDGTDSVGTSVSFEVTQYDDDRQGAIVETVRAFGEPMVADLHTMVWDGTDDRDRRDRPVMQTLRDDARSSSVSLGDDPSTVTIENRLRYDGLGRARYDAECRQQARVSASCPALVVEGELSFHGFPPRFGYTPEGPHTLYTVANPVVGDDHNEGWVTTEDGTDLVVATNGAYSLAIGHRLVALDGEQDDHENWPANPTAFDGHRIGQVGVAEGEAKSAWADIYEAADGWIHDRSAGEGDIDAGFGCFLGAASPTTTWRTALGFGTSDDEAVEHVRTALEAE